MAWLGKRRIVDTPELSRQPTGIGVTTRLLTTARSLDKHTDFILRLPEVRQITGLSRSSIYALQTTQAFPHSVKLSERAVGWLESEVRSWLQARVQPRNGSIEELEDR